MKANYLDPNLNTADNSLFEQFYRTSVMEANRMERANVRCREVQHRSNNLKGIVDTKSFICLVHFIVKFSRSRKFGFA